MRIQAAGFQEGGRGDGQPLVAERIGMLAVVAEQVEVTLPQGQPHVEEVQIPHVQGCSGAPDNVVANAARFDSSGRAPTNPAP